METCSGNSNLRWVLQSADRSHQRAPPLDKGPLGSRLGRGRALGPGPSPPSPVHLPVRTENVVYRSAGVWCRLLTLPVGGTSLQCACCLEVFHQVCSMHDPQLVNNGALICIICRIKGGKEQANPLPDGQCDLTEAHSAPTVCTAPPYLSYVAAGFCHGKLSDSGAPCDNCSSCGNDQGQSLRRRSSARCVSTRAEP